MRSVAVAATLLVCAPLHAGLKVGDAHGRIVPNATVTILLDSKNQAAAVFGDEPVVHRTDAAGTVPVSVPRVDGAMVVVDHERYAPATLAVDTARPLTSITLQEGITLGGRITGDGATPLAGTVCAIRTVTTRRNGATFEVKRCADVDAAGAWTLQALPAGPQRLEIAVPAYLPLTKTIALPGESWSGALENGLRALVHVEDAAGRPAAGATVTCDGAVPATTDARGVARVAVSRSGAKCRALASEGAESPSIAIDAPSTARQTLRLQPVRVVTGILVADDESATPAPRFTLLGKLGDFGQSGTRVEPLHGREGAFRIRVPDDAPHALRLEAPGMLSLTTGWFALPPGGGTTDLGVLVLRRGAGLRGRVVHAATQEPLAGAVVSLEAQGRARIVLGAFGKSATVTDSDGSFTVAGLGVGSYRMRVHWADLPPFETAIDLLEETIRTSAPIALHPGVRVSGRVSRGDGEPLGAARVELVPSRLFDTEPVASVHTAADGAFGPLAVAPGAYRLLVRGDDVLSDQEIDVPADGESLAVDVRIRSTRLLAIVRENGVPVTGGEVLLQRAADLRGGLGVAVARNPRVGRQYWSGRSESLFAATVGPAGTFRMSDVPAGRMVLEYYGTSGQRVTRTIDIPDEPDATITVDIDGWVLQGRIDGDIDSDFAARVELVDAHGNAVFAGPADATGTFAIAPLASGTYTLVASAEGYRSSDPLSVVIGNEAPQPVQLRLTKAADATLDLELQREGEAPAGGVAVAIVDAVGRQLRAFPTWPDGRLHVTGLPPGKVHVIWSDPLSGVGTSPPIQLRSGIQHLRMVLEPGKDLIARCEGVHCSGARLGALAFMTEHGIDLAPFLQRMGSVVYSDDGVAYLGRLAPGTYGVRSGSDTSFRLNLGSGPGEVDLFLTRR